MSLSILFVADDADIRTIVSLSLSLAPGVEVRVAASGAEALDAVAAGFVPDVAVLDVMMPGMDGLALLERLHARPSTSQVILMTAQARGGGIASYLGRGAIGVITTPFDPIDLAPQVRTCRTLLNTRDRRPREPARPTRRNSCDPDAERDVGRDQLRPTGGRQSCSSLRRLLRAVRRPVTLRPHHRSGDQL